MAIQEHHAKTVTRHCQSLAKDGASSQARVFLDTRLPSVNHLYYRQEDQFVEASNSMRLKQLHRSGDYTGLLEFALLLNHQACSSNSKVRWMMKEVLDATRPGNTEYQMPEQLKTDLESMGWKEN